MYHPRNRLSSDGKRLGRDPRVSKVILPALPELQAPQHDCRPGRQESTRDRAPKGTCCDCLDVGPRLPFFHSPGSQGLIPKLESDCAARPR